MTRIETLSTEKVIMLKMVISKGIEKICFEHGLSVNPFTRGKEYKLD